MNEINEINISAEDMIKKEENSDERNERLGNQDLQINLDDFSDTKFGEKKEKPDLDGEKTEITEIEFMTIDDPKKTQSGKIYKDVVTKIYYTDNNYENYSGLRIYQQKDGTFNKEPTFHKESNSALATLFKRWLKHEGKVIEEVSIKEFLENIKGKKVKITKQPINFMGKTGHKNIIGEFLE